MTSSVDIVVIAVGMTGISTPLTVILTSIASAYTVSLQTTQYPY